MTAPDREIELKFLLSRDAADAVLAALPRGETAVKDLHAIYFDTADHWLRRQGFGLRVRRSGDQRVQTLKSALGADGGRDEWEWPVKTDAPEIALLAETPAALPDGAALVPLFTVTSRRAVRMIEEGGALVELVIDAGEIRAGHRSVPLLELEIELKTGNPSALRTLAERLARVAPLTPSAETKAERGYRLLGKT
ncbi:CYTH domain-containing protein [Brevundimonas sp. UBA2416]|uniref:CYTH domain-containing protein n=1 Tax=Brevundimonas sp. UBA2416 TaxID=1946124 RepID=UPI0025BA0783|nr:CYTH domain-containing protein [Brevundimonas sp. UBA2416]HRD45541.1 CYTH domain-containing protein [Caulobacter sp.]